ncbi:glycerate kinase [bacterium]|nr:glycerate kinase [bacterium]
MKIVLAPDSFKGSLSASGVCDAMAKGILAILPDSEIERLPMADGGEGTVRTLIDSVGGTLDRVSVTDPLGESVTAEYGLLKDGETAVIEMASASGLSLVPEEKRNPMKTTTYGTGELIRAVLEKGCRKIILGIGGSATTDCGTGMAQALGVRFFNANGYEISDLLCGELMGQIEDMDCTEANEIVKGCEIAVACDVRNPLLGEKGAVRVYSRQKGADDQQIETLEKNMHHVIGVIEKKMNRSFRDIPGAGAAGGMGAGLMAFARARLVPGVELILKTCRFAERIQHADLIFTGEGQIDFQTAFGKTVSGVAKEARKQAIPVIAIAGSIVGNIDPLYDLGISSVFSICPGPIALKTAEDRAASLIEDCMKRIIRILLIDLKRN